MTLNGAGTRDFFAAGVLSHVSDFLRLPCWNVPIWLKGCRHASIPALLCTRLLHCAECLLCHQSKNFNRQVAASVIQYLFLVAVVCNCDCCFCTSNKSIRNSKTKGRRFSLVGYSFVESNILTKLGHT